MLPRFQPENFQQNLDIVQKLEQFAAQNGCTASQLAVAWVMAQGDHIFPIPGTKRIKYLEENDGALNIHFTKEELKTIDAISPKNAASGSRYTEMMMKFMNA